MKDFSFTQFLERFCFKNPKKITEKASVDSNAGANTASANVYIPHGTRARPVSCLTDANCTEDELYILNYMKQKQEQKEAIMRNNAKDDVESVDDDEFENYLNSLNPKTKKVNNEEDLDIDINYINELKNDLHVGKRQRKEHKCVDNKEVEGSDSSEPGFEMETDENSFDGGYDEESADENEDSEDELIDGSRTSSLEVDDIGTESDEEPDFKKMKVARNKTSFSTTDGKSITSILFQHMILTFLV